MPRYHVHPITGVPDVCHAKMECPFGDVQTDHYSTKKEARQAFEQSMKHRMFDSNGSDDKEVRRIQEEASEILAEAASKSKDPVRGYLMKASLDVLTPEISDEADIMLSYHYAVMRSYKVFDSENSLSNSMTKASNLVQRSTEMVRDAMLKSETGSDSYMLFNEKDRIAWMKQAFYGRGKAEDVSAIVSFSHADSIDIDDTKIFTVMDDKQNPITIREAISDTHPDGVYVGRVTVEKAETVIREQAENLVKNLEYSEGFVLPDKNWDMGESGFRRIAAGGESVIYLDEKTMMAYKIPHSDSLHFSNVGEVQFYYDEETGESVVDESDLQQNVAEFNNVSQPLLINSQRRYDVVDRDELEYMNASYAKTYFMGIKDSAGRLVPVIAQPYLDPERYVPFHANPELVSSLSNIGLTDVNAANMRVDVKTNKIVVFDCILDA